jgi:hypothetical protein
MCVDLYQAAVPRRSSGRVRVDPRPAARHALPAGFVFLLQPILSGVFP